MLSTVSAPAGDAPGIAEYFRGTTRGWGLFEDRFGRLRREFTIDIASQSDGDALILDEHFLYDDGESEERAWRITRVGEDLYEGRSADVKGVALGRVKGNAIHWRYRFNLRVGARKVLVDFDEWMFLRSAVVAIDRSYLSKWGVRLGSVTLCYQKL
jgi:hypothetical protein